MSGGGSAAQNAAHLTEGRTAPPYSGEWYSCDGHCDGYVRATKPDGPWPGMVLVEISALNDTVGMTLTVDDARDLANHILAAAGDSEVLMRMARAASAALPGVSAGKDETE